MKSDYLDFYKELMLLLCDQDHTFSKQIYKDMHELKMMILYGKDVNGRDLPAGATYNYLCHVAFRVCKVLNKSNYNPNYLGKRLPDSIHNRMVLGEKNYAVEQYVKYCVRHKL